MEIIERSKWMNIKTGKEAQLVFWHATSGCATIKYLKDEKWHGPFYNIKGFLNKFKSI